MFRQMGKRNQRKTRKSIVHERDRNVLHHNGFYGALHTENRDETVVFLQEYELGTGPLRADMVMVVPGHAMKDVVRSFYRKHNVIEYKSPVESLTRGAFWNTQAYALRYMICGKEEILLDEMTVTMFCHRFPEKMIRKLEREGYEVVQVYPGILYVEGKLSIPAQVIIIPRLEGEEYRPYRILAKNAKVDDIRAVAGMVTEDSSEAFVEDIRHILSVSLEMNQEAFAKLAEEEKMDETVMKVFARLFDKTKREAEEDGVLKGRILEKAENAEEKETVAVKTLKKNIWIVSFAPVIS